MKSQKFELTWIGKDQRPRLEPRILLEDPARSYHAKHYEVKAKAEAGALWCKHAWDHARTIGARPWKYLLVPNDQVIEDKRLVDFESFRATAK